MIKSLSSAFIILSILSCNVFADQIFLDNGDRITGKIVKKDGDKIVVETKSVGVVSIAWRDVERIVADQELSLKLKDGREIKGTVSSSDDKLEVKTADEGQVVIDCGEIITARNDAEQKRYEDDLRLTYKPKFTERWTGSADLGFSVTTGNSETRSLTFGFRTSRETVRDKITAYANAVQSSNTTKGPRVVTAKAIWAGIRYDYNVSDRLFIYTGLDIEHDQPQKLNTRTVYGSGFGYKFVRSKRTQFDIFGGGASNFERFSTGIRRNTAEAAIGNDLKLKINSRVRLNERLALYPNVSDPGRLRAIFDSSLQTDISSWLGWHVTVSNRFNSHPTTAVKTNDLLISTGLRVSFGKKKK